MKTNTFRPPQAPIAIHGASRCAVPTCSCGQDLDIVRGHHCPRCGQALRRTSRAPAAALTTHPHTRADAAARCRSVTLPELFEAQEEDHVS